MNRQTTTLSPSASRLSSRLSRRLSRRLSSRLSSRLSVEQVIDDRTHAQESQTDVTAEDISYLEEDNRARVAESSEPTFSIYVRGCYVGAPEKACFYTGLPSVEILDVVFELVEQHMTSSVKLTRYNQMLLCLIRLRMNYLFKDIAYQLRISLSTEQRSFHATLDVLYAKLAFLIRWPDREQLRKTMPMCFRAAYQNKVVVILDCFELLLRLRAEQETRSRRTRTTSTTRP